ncbi:uncharacterized protein BJ171DRAFT_558570 [Polychytrium aggregatum]|uniref:uncharacterized protein n=1 Tax=Polychytrium aggregatum TaxID=110093 RepID=UPI0022FE95D7|nr:uncharacterized protein BJ171DRAFT_558570 [Polychytrium aggregatum]KAI9205189.1 hypothetical protein BJ171DRAFT_558570 [Polychytrium aggregatum]
MARQSRRLYCGNIPFGISEHVLVEFFNTTMTQLNMTTSSGNPVIAAQINHDKNYAFVEFRSPEEATAAMSFDGITFSGQSLKIRRPKDYQPPPGTSENGLPMHLPGIVSTNVPDSADKIFIGGLPIYLNDEQVMELLKSFGELRAFNLVKDNATSMSKGFAFCEYADPTITDIACQGLNGMELDDKKLVVQRASVGSSKGAGGGPGMGSLGGSFASSLLPSSLLLSSGGQVDPTNVVALMNMVTEEELRDNNEYEDIIDDIRGECSKFGVISSIKIPRPVQGQVFIHYVTKEMAAVAVSALAGRRFADRTVVAGYYSESLYIEGNLGM